MDDPNPFSASDDAHEASKRGRGGARDSMMLAATLVRQDDSKPVALRVRNISPGGMMADCPIQIDTGTAVTATLRNIGEVRGAIVWCREGRIGVAFERQIDPVATRKPVGQGKTDPSYVPPVRPVRRPGMRNG